MCVQLAMGGLKIQMGTQAKTQTMKCMSVDVIGGIVTLLIQGCLRNVPAVSVPYTVARSAKGSTGGGTKKLAMP